MHQVPGNLQFFLSLYL